MKKYVAVAGNIGVGKSSLVRLLSEKLGWAPFYEPEAHNPYLADFYNDMQTWSFHSQVFFLGQRLLIHRQIILQSQSAVIDRSVYEDAEVFARNLFIRGCMSQRDFETYNILYRTLVEFLPPPDLLIYLRAPVARLQERISQRGRGYENGIDPVYLEQLDKLYEEWISRFSLCPVLTILADDLNYVDNPLHLQTVIRRVQEKLTGKDELKF